MNLLAYILIIITTLLISLSTGLKTFFLASRLFKIIEQQYPDKYIALGMPSPNPLHDLNSYRSQSRNMKFSFYIWFVIFGGTPKNFPDGVNVRKLTKKIRIMGLAFLAAFILYGYVLFWVDHRMAL